MDTSASKSATSIFGLALLTACSHQQAGTYDVSGEVEGTYEVSGTVVRFRGASHVPYDAERACITSSGPTAFNDTLKIVPAAGGYVAELTGGCRLALDLQDKVLSARGAACELEEGGALRALGAVERVYDEFRLDLNEGTFSSRARTRRESVDPPSPRDGCAVVEGHVERSSAN